MSFSVDVNLLLYASDNASPHHREARAFLERATAGSEIFGLAWITAMSYLRMATHSRIFARPLSPQQAEANITRLIALPHVRLLSETESFWPHYRQCARVMSIRGTLVPDAHLACILRANGIRVLYTNDRDFRKFDFIEPRPFGPHAGG